MIGAPNSLNLNCKVRVMKEAPGPSVSEEIADIFTNYNIDDNNYYDDNDNKAGFILHARVCARIRAYTRAYADCRRSFLYFCRRLRPAHTRAYADCRRQSSNMLNFQGQRRPAQVFQPITKALQGHRGPTRCSA